MQHSSRYVRTFPWQAATMAERWFKWRWDESRGDENDHWGPSTWLFEVDADSWPLRQIEVYDAGPILRYGPDHHRDEYGGLGQARLDESENWPEGEITADEFEAAWTDD